MKTEKRNSYHVAAAEVGIRRIRFEVERYMQMYQIDLKCVRPDQLEVTVDRVAEEMILKLQTKIASKKFASKTVRFPSTWWDAFKHRFFTPRMLKKWPVKWDEVTLEASAYHPDIAIPDHQTFVEIMHASRSGIYQDWPDSTYSESR